MVKDFLRKVRRIVAQSALPSPPPRRRTLRLEPLETRLPLAALVNYTAVATDLSGKAISKIEPGTEFLLKVSVRDLQATPSGVFAAYVDVTFDPSLIAVSGPLSYGPLFANSPVGSTGTAGLLDEVGAFSGMSPTGGGQQLLFQIRLQALGEGAVTFALDPADSSPLHDTLLYDRDPPVPPSAISLVGASLVIEALPPQVSVNLLSADEGQDAVLSGSFRDGRTAAAHTLTVQWGDWNNSAPSTFDLPATNTLTAGQAFASLTDGAVLTLGQVNRLAGSVAFSVRHTYVNDGLWASSSPSSESANVVVTLGSSLDDSWWWPTSVAQATIRNAAPVIGQVTTNAGLIGAIGVNQLVTVSAPWTDAGWIDTHFATIAWGDGTATEANLAGGSGLGTLGGAHSYSQGGVYTVTITLYDQDQGATSRSVDVYVTGVGVVGQVLYAIGTSGDDTVSVASLGTRGWGITASFLGGTTTTVPPAGVARLQVMTGDGQDSVSISSKVKLTALVFGGAGDDTLRSGGGKSVLVGGDGFDRLVGGAARDLLLGGADGDNLQGQGGDDILIAGTTVHDTNAAALLSLLAEWSRANTTVASRAANLRNGGGFNGNVKLNAATVSSDTLGNVNSLSDGSGGNWFWLTAGRDVVVKKTKATILN